MDIKKFALCLCGHLLGFVCLLAQQPVLRFGADGKFKIVQFTDVHFQYHNPASDIALQRMEEVMDTERPDLVMLTGDVVYAAPADSGMRAVLDCIAKRRIPFAVTFGNHDDNFDKTRSELYDVIRAVPGNCQPDRGETQSPDFALPIRSSDNKRNAAVLYCLDSGTWRGDETSDYDWISNHQIEWYRNLSARHSEANGRVPLPSLAFFHIPLPEYNQASSDESAVLIGTRMEKACAPEVNSGMFVAMKECGDVMGIFVGHDHDNDYAVMWKDILLAYGRYTGGNTVYNHLPNGARVIVLKEGKRTFNTWIRLAGGQVVNKASYPDSFTKEDCP